MPIDLQQGELLAQLVLVAVVRVDIDRLSKKKRFIESVELLLDRLGYARRSAVADIPILAVGVDSTALTGQS